MPSSGKNPFDDDDDGDKSSGSGGGGKVVNHNPFDVDSEDSCRKTAPSGHNPFDSDDSSTSSNLESDDGIGKTTGTPTTNLALDQGSTDQSLNQPPTGKNPFDNSSDESDRASVNSETQTKQSSQVLSGSNPFDSASDDEIESSVDERDNSSQDGEREGSAAITDAVDNSSSPNKNCVSSVESAECDDCSETDSVPDETLEDDEEAQVLHHTTSDNDEESSARSQTGDEDRNKSDIEEAANEFNRDDENVRHNMPQSSLCIDKPDEASNPFSEETKAEETSTPLLQNDDDSYWNKEGIREAVASFDAKVAQEGVKQDVENPLAERSLTREPEVVRSSVRRKKVKNRYFKACLMVIVVWAAMIILISVALGMDWVAVHDQTKSDSLCTLCDGSGIGLNYSAFTLRPTRKPSSSTQSAFVNIATIKPPPENIAELCSPSIFLDHGPKKVPPVEKLVATCATACLPAACCVSDDDQARQALTTTLESQGMGIQASTLFSTIEGCNRGDNVAICDTYNDYCSTLYDIEHALDTLPMKLRQACNEEDEATSISTAFSRQYDSKRMSEKCKNLCLPLACCYETVEPTFATERKRKRQHNVTYTNVARQNMDVGESGCDGFGRPAGSMNAQICSAYSIFCESQDYPRTSGPTITPSYQWSNQPSYQLTQSPTTIGKPGPTLIPSSKIVESPSSHPTMSSSPIAESTTSPSYDISSTQASLFPTTEPSSSITKPSHLPTITSYPTPNSTSITNIDSSPSQHPTIISLEVNETLNSSFSPLPTLEVNTTQSSFVCKIVNSSIFYSLVPSETLSYSHEEFCAAVEAWNANNATTKIFAAEIEMKQRHELAAFFGHVLSASRAVSQCQTFITDENGKVYCKPDAYLGGNYTDPYCSISEDQDGCTCGPVPESSLFTGYIESDKLFYGRGPLHLSWSYNYLQIAEVLGVDLCSRPDLVALEEEKGWASAFWIWTSITSSAGRTAAISVAEGSYGGTMHAINSELDCQTGIYSEDYLGEITTKLDDYCKAASTLSLEKILEIDSCENLKSSFDTCKNSGTCPACRIYK
eukprot:scaffold14973_cov128-Skeletonema_dohrnii-CCMP3373.AAC.1